jgi:hypothetical protein
MLGCEADKLDRELDTLAARARTRALKVRITSEIRDAPETADTRSSTTAAQTSQPRSGSSTPRS